MPKKTAKVHHDEGQAHPTKDVVPEEETKPTKDQKKHHAKDHSAEKKSKHKHKHKKHKHHEHGSSKSKHPRPTKNQDQAVKVEHRDIQPSSENIISGDLQMDPEIAVPGVDKHRGPNDDDVNASLEEVSENFDKELEASFARFDKHIENLQANSMLFGSSASGMNLDEATSDEAEADSEEPTNTEHTEQDPLTKLGQLYFNKVINMNERRVDELESGLVAPHFPLERILEDIDWIGYFRNKKKDEKSPKLLLKVDFFANGAIEGTIGVKSSEEVASLEGCWLVSDPQHHPEVVDIVWLQTQDNSAVLVGGKLTVKEYKKDVAFDASIKGTFKGNDGSKKHGGTLCFKSRARTTHTRKAKAEAPVQTIAPRQSTVEFDLEAQTGGLAPIAIAVREPAQDLERRLSKADTIMVIQAQVTSRDASGCIIQPTSAQRVAQEDQDQDQDEVAMRRCRFISVGIAITAVLGIFGIYILWQNPIIYVVLVIIPVPVAWALFCCSAKRCGNGGEWIKAIATAVLVVGISAIFFLFCSDNPEQCSVWY